MSSQDMQFADPEWRPPEEREVNANSREQKTLPPRPINENRGEQPQWQTAPPSQEGYLGQGYAGSQPQTTWSGPSRPRSYRRRSPWLWIILAFIIIALMSGVFRSSGGSNRFSSPRDSGLGTSTFTFSGASTIVISGGVGDINVHTGGSGNDVIIQETTDGGTNVTPTKSGNTISVSVDQGSDTSFDVTVPANENLQLTTTDGSIQVNGVNGQMTLQSNNSGSITAIDDILANPSTLSSNSGSITFRGSIGSGNYQFQSTSGSVDVTLPSTSNFQVKASTNSGSMDNNFPGVPVQSHNGGYVASGNVGKSPSQAQVTLTSDSGDIHLHESS